MENYTKNKLQKAANSIGGVHPDWGPLTSFQWGFKEGAKWLSENMWISVEEELPPCSYNDLFLLGIDSEGNVDVVDIGYMHHCKDNIPRIDLFVSGELVKITHWMPIPKIKKGE